MRCPQILLAMSHPDSNAVKIKDNSANCAARGPRNATSRGAGARQAVMPHVAKGTDVGGTRHRIAVIVTAVAAMTVVTIVAMIVARADEQQHKSMIKPRQVSGGLIILHTLVSARSLMSWLSAYHNELDNIAEPAERLGPPGNSVTGVCGIPPQKPNAMWLSSWTIGRGRGRPATRRSSS